MTNLGKTCENLGFGIFLE